MQHSDRDGSESSMNSDAFARRPALLAPPASPNLLTEEELSEEEAPAEQSVQPNNPSNNPSNNPLSFRPEQRRRVYTSAFAPLDFHFSGSPVEELVAPVRSPIVAAVVGADRGSRPASPVSSVLAVVDADRGTRPASPVSPVPPVLAVSTVVADPVASRRVLDDDAPPVDVELADDVDVTVGQVKAQLLRLAEATHRAGRAVQFTSLRKFRDRVEAFAARLPDDEEEETSLEDSDDFEGEMTAEDAAFIDDDDGSDPDYSYSNSNESDADGESSEDDYTTEDASDDETDGDDGDDGMDDGDAPDQRGVKRKRPEFDDDAEALAREFAATR